MGAPKAASTWLYRQLLDHPGVDIPQKEIHFFSDETRWSRGIDWYEAIFRGCPPGALRAELSPSYLSDSAALDRIAAMYPDVRILVGLRHPVDRLLSEFEHGRRDGTRAGSDLEEAISADPGLVQRSGYADQLCWVFDRFLPAQVHVILHDDVVDRPVATMRALYRFCGLDVGHMPRDVGAPVNAATRQRIRGLERARRRVAGLLEREDPRQQRVASMLRRAIRASRVPVLLERLNAGGAADRAPVDPMLRSQLLEQFERDVVAVETLVGRRLDGWRI